MSVDLARLNTGGTNPDVSFIIDPDEDGLTSVTPVYYTGELTTGGGQWGNHSFDYVAPCGETETYVAFRNRATKTNGNDLTLDNLSMKAIIPQIRAQINPCDETSYLLLDNTIGEVFAGDIYKFQWQIKNGNNFEDISGAVDKTPYALTQLGTYRLSIYTYDQTDPNTTYECRMFSNEIIIDQDLLNCFIVAVPDAIDDDYDLVLTNIQTGNVIDNDNPSEGVSRSSLSVTSFEVDGVNYAPNTTAILNEGGSEVGIFSLNGDGSFKLQIKVGYSGEVPEVKYRITEQSAGQDSAYVRFHFVSYAIVIKDFCAECPIDLVIQSVNPIEQATYVLFDNTDYMPVGTGVIDGNTLTFQFTENKSGMISYLLRKNGEELLFFSLQIAPRTATWAPSTVVNSGNWFETFNWTSDTGTGYPLSCTNVIIPGGLFLYPTLTTTGTRCEDITFEPGATIGQIQNLLYRKAFVDYQPIRDNWMMLTAPLKYIYSADYSADPSWGDHAGIDPLIYMRLFDVRYTDDESSIDNPDGTEGISVGNFSKAFANLKVGLELTDGFVLKVGQGTNAVFQGTYHFPRLNADGTEIEYKYHNSYNGDWIEDGAAGVSPDYYPFRFTDVAGGRGTQEPTDDNTWITGDYDIRQERGRDNRYRFIWEDGSNTGAFTVSLPNAATTNIVGNPLMSHIDFEAFYSSNSSKVQPYYRIWDGTSFYSYAMAGHTDDGVWRGLPPLSTGTDVQAGNRYIAPMQAFFVELIGEDKEIIFDPDAISVAVSGALLRSRAAAEQTDEGLPENVLTISLQMLDTENKSIVAVLPLAKDDYDPSEDVYKLFSFNRSVPEIYTIADGQAIEINAVSTAGDTKMIPLGIRTDMTGSMRIAVDGVADFKAYNDIKLIDTSNGKNYNLRNESSLVFEKTSNENSEGRFYIYMEGNTSGIKEKEDYGDNIKVFGNDGVITVSTPLDIIENLELYDVAGRLLDNKQNVGVSYYQFSPDLPSGGIWVLKVKTKTVQKSFKIKI